MKFWSSIICFVAIVTAPGAASAYCAGGDRTLPNYRPNYYSVPLEFRRAEFVIEGLVTRETWIDDEGKPKALAAPFGSGEKRPWGLAAPYVGAWYDIRVLRRFKGQAPSHLRLFSENSTARFWLNEGHRYLLFISEEAFDDPVRRAMTIDTCGNSARSNAALLTRLKRLATR